MSVSTVGIAASPGGHERVSKLLATLPARSGMAPVRFQHFDADRERLLTYPLTQRTALPSEIDR